MGRFSLLGILWFTAWFAANLGVLVFAPRDESWPSFVMAFGLLAFAVISSILMDLGYFEVAESVEPSLPPTCATEPRKPHLRSGERH